MLRSRRQSVRKTAMLNGSSEVTMTDVQFRRLQNRAASNAQRYRLKTEKAINDLQSQLSKIAKSKVVVSNKRYESAVQSYSNIKNTMADLERAMVDLYISR